MSEVQKYVAIGGMMPVDSGYGLGVFVQSNDYDAAQSKLSALLEELATAKRNEQNSEVAYKAAIEKQEELRKDADQFRESSAQLAGDLLGAEQRLADAERRNEIQASELEIEKANAAHWKSIIAGEGQISKEARRYRGIRDILPLNELIDITADCQSSAEWDLAVDAALNPNPESDKEIWNDMVDLPAHKAGAKYRMILDDVQQDCVELEMEGRKRWFYGEENGAFPEDEIQAWLPINPNPEAASHDE